MRSPSVGPVRPGFVDWGPAADQSTRPGPVAESPVVRIKPLVAGLSVLAALALACGSGTEVTPGAGEPEPESGVAAEASRQPVAVPVGKPIDVATDVLTATYTLSKAEVRSKDQFGLEAQNGAYLLAFLRVDVAKGETFACACELSLVQKDGKVREQTYASFKGKPAFESAELKAGQHADGWVMWDVPKSAVNSSQVQLKIAQLFEDSAYGYWTVKA